MFNKCLSGKIKNEIEYENVLDCKSVAFQDYMDRVLDFEEKYLNDALNKYAWKIYSNLEIINNMIY